MASDELGDRVFDILVLGIDRKGLALPEQTIRKHNYTLHFEKLSTAKKIQDYSGVILFQGSFETFEWRAGFESYLHHDWKQDALDRRKKEVALLQEAGGFVVVLLCESFIDSNDSRNFKNTDLAKALLNHERLYRSNFNQRTTDITIVRDEFRTFLQHFGAATSHFQNNNREIEFLEVARVGGTVVSMVLNRQNYFIPALLPENRPEAIEEYFKLLADGLISSVARLHRELPAWLNTFTFGVEIPLIEERERLVQLRRRNDESIERLRGFKAVLSCSGSDLVAAVVEVFREGLECAVDAVDELKEDFKVIDNKGTPLMLCEVKGVNGGVKREYINQADSHRERAGLGDRFPCLLIVNTKLKNAKNLGEKDDPVADEQISHAAKLGVLVVRTLDLLWLLEHVFSKRLTSNEALLLLAGSVGWLEVDANGSTLRQAPKTSQPGVTKAPVPRSVRE